jgi:hypothetical protein
VTERRSPDPVPDPPHAPGGAADPLADLLGLVTERARSLSAPDAGEDAMRGLQEAVDALGRYLDILAFLRSARAGTDEPAPGESDARPAVEPDGHPAAAAAEMEPARPTHAEPAPEGHDGGPAPEDRDAAPVPEDHDAGTAPEDHDAVAASAGPAPRAAPDRDAARAAERDYPPFRDQLTGLHSREGFDAVAAGELKRCRRHGRVFSMLLFELAGLDESGLSRAASAILASIRESDLAGRRDAKVLSVALPETSPTEARVVAERILRQFEGTGAWGSWARLALVTHPTHGETMRHLLDASRVQLTLPTQRVLASAENGHWPG